MNLLLPLLIFTLALPSFLWGEVTLYQLGNVVIPSRFVKTPQDFGAIGDLQQYVDGVINGDNTLSSATRACTSGDLGKIVVTADSRNVDSSIRNGTYEWIAGGAANEWYVRLVAGSAHSKLASPDTILENGSPMTKGTVGSLTTGQWGYGDHGTLAGNFTVYVYSTVDPDTQAADYYQTQFWSWTRSIVSSCDTTTFVLGAALDRTGSGIKFTIATDDTTAFDLLAAYSQSNGTPIYVPQSVNEGYYLEKTFRINNLASGSGSGRNISFQCEPGSKIVRSPVCDPTNCASGGSQMFIGLHTAGEVDVQGCHLDGMTDWEENSSLIRAVLLSTIGKRVRVRENKFYNSPSYGAFTYVDNNEATNVLVNYTDNEVDGAWEGGLMTIGPTLGTAAKPASIVYRDNKIDAPTRHPNANQMGVQSVNGVLDEIEAGASSAWFLNNRTIVNNTIRVGGDRISSPSGIILSPPAGAGEYFIRKTQALNNFVECSDTGNLIPACPGTLVNLVVGNRDQAGDDLGEIRVSGNTIQHSKGTNGVAGHISVSTGISGGGYPTNRVNKLYIGDNFAPTVLNSQTYANYTVNDDWDIVHAGPQACIRSKDPNQTKFTGCIELKGNVRHLSHDSVGGFSDNNLAITPFVLADNKSYGLQPNQKMFTTRSPGNNGDKIRIANLSASGCAEVYLARLRSMKLYRFCYSRVGPNSTRVLVPVESNVESIYDFELLLNEDNGSNVSELSIWQRTGGAAATYRYIIGVMPLSIEYAGVGNGFNSFPYTPLSTNSGTLAPLKQPSDVHRLPFLWRWVINYTDFTSATSTEALIWLVVPAGFQVSKVYAKVLTAFTHPTATIRSCKAGPSANTIGYLVETSNNCGATGILGDASAEVGTLLAASSVQGGHVPNATAVDNSSFTLTLNTGALNALSNGKVLLEALLIPVEE